MNFDELTAFYAWPSERQPLRRHVRLNMAVTVSGDFVDPLGLSTGLSSPEDRLLLKIIRSGADAILVGAGTIRAEGWNLPPTGTLFVLSRTENLPWNTCPDTSRVRIITGAKTPQEILNFLGHEGIQQVLVEGGGSVARQFARVNLFDDVCLTVTLESEHDGWDTEERNRQLSRAFAGLLGVPPEMYDLMSTFPVAQTPLVFARWRRAISSPPPAAD